MREAHTYYLVTLYLDHDTCTWLDDSRDGAERIAAEEARRDGARYTVEPFESCGDLCESEEQLAYLIGPDL